MTAMRELRGCWTDTAIAIMFPMRVPSAGRCARRWTGPPVFLLSMRRMNRQCIIQRTAGLKTWKNMYFTVSKEDKWYELGEHISPRNGPRDGLSEKCCHQSQYY